MNPRCQVTAAGRRSEWISGRSLVLIALALVMSISSVGCATSLSGRRFAAKNSDYLCPAVNATTLKPVFVQRVSTGSGGQSDFVLTSLSEPVTQQSGSGVLTVSPPPISTTLYDPVPEAAVLAEPGYQMVPAPEPARLNFCTDVHGLRSRLFEEINALATCENAYFIGTAAGVAWYLHDNVDNRVADSIAQNGPRWGPVSDAITDFGHSFPVQLPLIGGLYATSLWQQNEELHELTLTMFTTYKFTLLSSVALQYATRTHTSGNGIFDFMADSGFPSQQTSTSFALAAVVDEAYGWKAGLPAYLFAGLIGFSEVDQNQHRVSDVVFGAALGYVIGKSVGALHYRPDAPCKLIPLIDTTTGTQGMGVEFLF